MIYKRLTSATLLSLPLIPFLLSGSVNVDDMIAKGNFYWFIPIVVENFCFFTLYKISQVEHTITPKEQKLYVILMTSLFGILCGALTAMDLLSTHASTLRIEYFLLVAYALFNLIFITKRISVNPQQIQQFFMWSYVYPYLLVVFFAILVGLLNIQSANILAVFFIIRNFLGMKLMR